MAYSYLACDLRTNRVLARLPLTDVSYDHDLNDIGSFSASMTLFTPGTDIGKVKTATEPGRTALYIDCDGHLVFGGIIWKRQKTSGGVLQLSGSGFLSYYARTLIVTSTFFHKSSGDDQFDIARALVRAAAARPGGDIGVVHGTSRSGVLRDASYAGADQGSVLDALRALASLANGFDFAIRTAYDTNQVPVKFLALGYPQLGRPPARTGLLVEYPGNISQFDWPEEGDRIVSTVYVRGDTTDAAPPVSRTNPDLAGAGYPLLEEAVSAPGLTSTAALGEFGAAYLAAYGRPVVLPTLTLPPGAAAPALHTYGPGDYMRARLTDPEWLPARGARAGFDGAMRVVKQSVRIDNDGAGHEVTLTMSPLLGWQASTAMFTPPAPSITASPVSPVTGDPVTLTVLPGLDPALELASLTLTRDGEPAELTAAGTYTFTAGS